jgi:GNAT superfamily N-acetyltransferase
MVAMSTQEPLATPIPDTSAAISVRLATPADDPILLAALAEYHPTVDAAVRLRWLYEGNPHGRALTWIAFEGGGSGDWVGITSFFPRRMIVDGVETRGALGGDGYVRPAHRRRGIGGMLHAASRRDMPAHGIELMFGTPKRANVTPLGSSGAHNISETVRYVRPLSARLLDVLGVLGQTLPQTLLAPRRGGPRLFPMVPNDRRVDAVWEETRGELRIATVRDAAFYTWRFLRSPSQRQLPFVVMDAGRAVGACAIERVENKLHVIDVVAPARAWDRVFAAIAAHVPECDTLEIQLARKDAEARWMWRHGFFAREARPLNLLLPSHCALRRAAVLSDPRRWYFTWAESDVDRD